VSDAVDLDAILGGEPEPRPSGVQWYSDVPWYADLLACTACSARLEATRVVPGDGPLLARIGVLGRNPGREEDQYGSPFVGRAGDVLNDWLQAMAIDRQKILVMNLVKCHTHDDRKPTKKEVQVCGTKWLREELKTFEHVEVLLTLGEEASRFVLGVHSPSMGKMSFAPMRVRLDDAPSRVLQVIPLVHPSYLLHKPSARQSIPALLARVVEHLRSNAAEAYESCRL